MTSELRVDKIVPTTGAPTGGGGGVIQVVSATKTDTQTFTSIGNHDITGLSVTITPKFATSKMLVMYTVNVGPYEGGYSAGVTIVRDSTEIFIGDAAGNRRQVSTFTSISNTGGGTDYNMVHLSGHHLDSPSTTSATTYKLQLKNLSSESLYINQSKNDGDQTYITRTASSITVMEISG